MIFFLHAFSIYKTISFLFFLPKKLATDNGFIDERYSDGHISSVN